MDTNQLPLVGIVAMAGARVDEVLLENIERAHGVDGVRYSSTPGIAMRNGEEAGQAWI